MDFLREQCWRDGRLLAVHTDGRSRFPAYLDDHASLAWGLLELLQARWHGPWLAWAIELAEIMLARFEDRDAGGFFFTADDHEQLILRPKTFADDATPSGNGVAARVLVRLGYLLAEPRYLDAAERTLRAAWPALEKYPQAHVSLLMALDELIAPPDIVVLRGSRDDLDTWRTELDKAWDPKRCVAAIPADEAGLPEALAGQEAAGWHGRLRVSRDDLLRAARLAGRSRAGAAKRARRLRRAADPSRAGEEALPQRRQQCAVPARVERKGLRPVVAPGMRGAEVPGSDAKRGNTCACSAGSRLPNSA